jgi:hypothetical protein
METLKRYYRMDRRAIHLLRFFLEGYDGIAGLTTIDPREGRVVLRIAPGCEGEVETLIEEMQRDMMLRPLDALR